MKVRCVSWWCICTFKNGALDRVCAKCGRNRVERHARVAQSERSVMYINPATGERRTPPRADMPMPDVYVQQGYERREIMSMTAFERETGLVHEATNFNEGNAPVVMKEPEPGVPADVKDRLIRDIADAAASGPWTGGLPE